MIIASYLLPLRISLFTNLITSSTIYLTGLSCNPEACIFSFAHATHPFNTVLKNTLGTFTSLAQASSVNFTSGSILEAAYLTVSKLMPLLAGIGSDTGLSSFLLLFLLGNPVLPLL